MKIKVNEDILKLKESATLAINLKAKGLRAQGKTVYHWGFGQSPFPVPNKIQEELKLRTSHKEYLPTAGLSDLRKTLSDYYSREYELNFDLENIFIAPGSKELIFQMIYALEGHFIVPAPSWVSYGPQITLKGQAPHYFQTKRENNYKMIPQKLDKTLTSLNDKQCVLILNSPSNPTGQYYDASELKELTTVFKKHEVIVISDEIYGQVNFEKEYTPSLAQYYPEGTIITGGLSKAQSAGGYRLGYMIVPENLNVLIKPLKAMISETYSAVSTPIQYAAIPGWSEDSDVKNYLLTCCEIHNQVGHYFYDRFTKMNILTPKPQGAFYLFIDFENYREKLQKLNINTSVDLSDYLLEKLSIALLPGEDFYYPKESLTARIAFVDYDGEKILSLFKNKGEVEINKILENAPQIKDSLDTLENFLIQL